MPEIAGQIEPTRQNANDWLSLEEAAKLSGASVPTWNRRARRETTNARAQGRQSLARKAPSASGRGRHMWWVHRSLATALESKPAPSQHEACVRESLITRYPEHAVNLAYKRAAWLRRWVDACQRRRDGNLTQIELARRVVEEAKLTEGAAFGISVRSLQTWRRAYYAIAPDGAIRGIVALIDGRAAAKRPSDDAETPALLGRTVDAVTYFYMLYRTRSQPSVKFCHELTVREARQRGWKWSPSYSATRKWLKHDNVSLSYLLREGKDAWCRRFMPHNEIDYRLIEPGQLYQTDHHQCDFWVEYNGEQLRPWFTVTEDSRSRVIVGWHLGPAPHTDAIVANYLMAFRRFAIPERLRIDNGRDFASRLLMGVTKAERDQLRREYGRDWQRIIRRDANLVDCVDPRFMGIVEELGIDTLYAIPYSPWSKGQVERLFGTFESRCGVTFPTYCGRSSLKRPECLEVIRRGFTKDQKRRLRKRYGRDWKKVAVLKFVDQRAVPSLDEARTAIAEWIADYHYTAHSAGDMDGFTPLEMWATASSLRRADDRALLFLMHARGIYRVGANGVAFQIGGARLTYGAGNPALYRYVGRDVCISVDSNDVSCCFAFTADRDRRFIGKLESNARISPMATVDALREANAAVGRRRKMMHKAQREAPARTRTAAEEMAAKRRERARELRATGTDDLTSHANIVPVKTGFERGTVSVAKIAGSRSDRKSRDLADAAKALGLGTALAPKPRRRPRASDDLLRGGHNDRTESALTDDGETDGKDAGNSAIDVFRLIAGADRHEREPD